MLVSAHGNSLRSLIMAIEGLTPEQILKREWRPAFPFATSWAPTRGPICRDTFRMIIRELTTEEYDSSVPRLAEIWWMR